MQRAVCQINACGKECVSLYNGDYVENEAKVARVRLNFRDGWQINDAKVRAVMDGAQVVYVIFDKETAFPDDGKVCPDMMHHQRGWELTYQLESAPHVSIIKLDRNAGSERTFLI